MTCKACDASEGLQACLYCGYEVCALHRGELGGVAACTPCLREEHERKQARKAASATPAPGADRAAQGSSPGGSGASAAASGSAASGSPSSRPTLAPAAAEKTVARPGSAPVTPPNAAVPLLAGLAAGAAAGGYAYWLIGRILAEGPPWLPSAAAGAIALVAFAGVWAIVKSR